MKKIKLLLISIAIFMLILASFSQVNAYSIHLKNQNTTKNNIDIDSEYQFAPEWYYKPNNYAELVEWYQELL